ncbi:DUF2599 domain-containing protein [Mycobacterium palustre]|uniref:DUF2599 domain-containing protein n=1 Tax=Mycobacterium palustre TaxID=153971 RepID=A0A1X1ZTA5_9MYCO|nr:DUF2599 domain-containing protein [Mycobacterium palustre]MCV7100342.1 DUF2599 domain-containing protein [Mycobacterium palustre]ORW26600.1 hypothetical protein AWC19_03790 [Mycobacterium palustre]
MKSLLAVPAALLVALPGTPAASADPGAGAANPSGPSYPPPFVDHVQWTRWNGLPSLRVFPTPSGRLASRQPAADAAADEAWAEVLAQAPGADTPGMRAQFVCHWQFAELAQPGKSSWNLEPWRPVVDDAEMAATGCNPGAPEETF